MTRIKDEQRGEILIFKEAEWQTLRVETNALANADSSEEERLLHTPLRLIANQSKVRITMKKRLSGKKCLKNLTHLPSDVRHLSEILCICVCATGLVFLSFRVLQVHTLTRCDVYYICDGLYTSSCFVVQTARSSALVFTSFSTTSCGC